MPRLAGIKAWLAGANLPAVHALKAVLAVSAGNSAGWGVAAGVARAGCPASAGAQRSGQEHESNAGRFCCRDGSAQMTGWHLAAWCWGRMSLQTVSLTTCNWQCSAHERSFGTQQARGELTRLLQLDEANIDTINFCQARQEYKTQVWHKPHERLKLWVQLHWCAADLKQGVSFSSQRAPRVHLQAQLQRCSTES